MAQRKADDSKTEQRTSDATPGEFVAALKRAEEAQGALCLEAIKAIHRAGPTVVPLDEVRPTGWIGRGPGAIAKVSPSGQLIGWYRGGQKSGRPSRRMPLEREHDRRWAEYAKAVQAAVPIRLRAQVLARRSALARRQKSRIEPILTAYTRLQAQGVPRHQRVAMVARQLHCTPEYVRRVLRARALATSSKKNTT